MCDLGFPEIGSVRLEEIRSVHGLLGLPVERDLHFEGRYPISVYARAARRAQSITTRPDLLEAAAGEREAGS